MKICAIICEYNPFHNGHLYQLREAKRLSGADAVVCVMSGNFVQRGEESILDKFTRARHAVLAGADVVIELPTVFATSPAEIFAKGAVHILSSIPGVDTLCFGAENANKAAFKLAARTLLNEPEEVSKKIKTAVKMGVSYAKARAEAWAGFLPMELLHSPNNVLGLEYTKAILERDCAIDILPISRIGSGYNETGLQENYSSATALRNAIKNRESVYGNLPNFVEKDLPKELSYNLDVLEKHALLIRNSEDIAEVCDCSEGLENAFKKAAEKSAPLAESLTSARYTASRIRRIALQNLLQIKETLIKECLSSPLYLRILAAKKERSDVLSALVESAFPVVVRTTDADALCPIAKNCFEKDLFAEKTYAVLRGNVQDKKIFV